MSIFFPNEEQVAEMQKQRPLAKWIGYPLFCNVNSEIGQYLIKCDTDDQFDIVAPVADEQTSRSLIRLDVVRVDGIGSYFNVYFVPQQWSDDDIMLFVVGYVLGYDDFYFPPQIRKWNPDSKTPQWFPNKSTKEIDTWVKQIVSDASDQDSRLKNLVSQQVASQFVGTPNDLYPPTPNPIGDPNWEI